MRQPEDILALVEAERSESEALQMAEQLSQLLLQPGWKHIEGFLSKRRDDAFQQLRGVRGTRDVIGESFLRWQAVDGLYEDIQDFIQQTIRAAEEILRRRSTTLEEAFLREQLHGRYTEPSDPGTGESGFDPGAATSGAARPEDSY